MKKRNPFIICAERARHVKCEKCLHHDACALNGAPTSRMGLYMAALELNIMPRLTAALNMQTTERLNVTLTRPSSFEIRAGHIAAFSVFNGKNVRMFRVPIDYLEDEESITIRALSKMSLYLLGKVKKQCRKK